MCEGYKSLHRLQTIESLYKNPGVIVQESRLSVPGIRAAVEHNSTTKYYRLICLSTIHKRSLLKMFLNKNICLTNCENIRNTLSNNTLPRQSDLFLRPVTRAVQAEMWRSRTTNLQNLPRQPVTARQATSARTIQTSGQYIRPDGTYLSVL